MNETTAVILLTNGSRRDYIRQTVESANASLEADERIVAADTDDKERLAWLKEICVGWTIRSIFTRQRHEIVPVKARYGFVRMRKKGYCAAVGGGVAVAVATGHPWIFWLEDDFVFNRPVQVDGMKAVLRHHPHVAQMALTRQAWFPEELRAGSLFAMDPGGFVQRDGWVEHRQWWTTNPMLTRRDTLIQHPWPRRINCELEMTRLLLSQPDISFGYWGSLDDEPHVTHIGYQKGGTGY